MYSHNYAAEAYDLIHADRGKDYAAEAGRIAKMIRLRRPSARTLLDVACGTGSHLSAFAELGFEVTGVELSAAMRDAARRRLPHAVVHEGDMRSFDLGREFDIVVCLFSAIGYMNTKGDLNAAIERMSRHLNPAGAMVVEPWFGPDEWAPDSLHADCAKSETLAVARVSRSGRDGDVSTIEMRYVIATPEGIESFDESHHMGLFAIDDYRAAFQGAGLQVEHDVDGLIGRGLFVGTSQAGERVGSGGTWGS